MCRDVQHPPSQGHLASRVCPWTLPIPVTSLLEKPFRWQWQPPPNLFFFPSLQAPAQPLPPPALLAHPPTFETFSVSFVPQPTPTSPFVPSPMNLLAASLLILTSQPITFSKLHLEVCHGGKEPRRHNDRARVLGEAQHLLKISSLSPFHLLERHWGEGATLSMVQIK